MLRRAALVATGDIMNDEQQCVRQPSSDFRPWICLATKPRNLQVLTLASMVHTLGV